MNEKNELINEEIYVVQHPDYQSEIVAIIRGNLSPKLKKERILDYHENDVAAAMELLTKDERIRLYRILDTKTLADIFEYLERLNEYISELSIRKRADILSHLETATAVEYLEQCEKDERDTILELMNDEVCHEITLISSFDEDEIGSRMTTNFVSIRADSSVRQAMKELIRQAAENDNISTIYVVDAEDCFLGAIDLKDLIIARENTELNSIIKTSYPYVYSNEKVNACIERIKEYSEDSIPVLSSANRIEGVLTAQDMTELIDDTIGEDYAMLAGLTAEEDLHEPVKKSIGKRLPWLVVLLGLGILVSSVVGLFEPVVSHLAVIVSFQSLILGMAGNVGTQSLAVTVRVLADERIKPREKLYLVGKEARVGLLNGLILGFLSFVFIGAYLVFLKGEPLLFGFSVSFCTGVALLVSMLLSGISGTVIPLLFKKMKIDPAVASGPLITTVNDLIAVVAYYGLAWILLINVLQY